jgi:hypothetical protein
MIRIDKKEFFEEYNCGDVYGLENLQKQLDRIGKNIFRQMKENQENQNISNDLKNVIAEKLCREEIQVIRANSLLNFAIRLNSLYIETQTTEYAEKHYSKTESLYSDVINDLFNILNITNEDFKQYAK